MDLPRLLTTAAERAGRVAAGAGGEVLRRLQHNRLPGVGQNAVTDDPATAARRWRAVTVLCDAGELGGPGSPPPPLDALADRIELRISPAPGDKGTELAARYRDRPSADDLAALRRALREAKQLVEVGEVLRVDPAPHGTRAPTPQGALLDGMAEKAAGEGVL